MYAISCEGNQIENLNLSNLRDLIPLHLDHNPNLKQVLLKTGRTFIYNDFTNISFSDCPNLEYLCVDEVNAVGFQNKIAGYGYTNCNLNSYCSFTPGGVYYTIQGNAKLDSNLNGCDSSDLIFPNLNLAITDGTNTGNFISNSSGNYSIPVQAGTQTVTPILENPTYFTISPSSFSVTFPNQTSPSIQNFCITPNGTHNDLK